MSLTAIIAVVVLVGSLKLALDVLLFLSARDLVRKWPELRQAWLGRGEWVAFSRRFGFPYAAASWVGAFAWVFATANLVPDTKTGAVIVFGPSMLMLAVGAFLGMLSMARKLGDY